VITVEGLTKAYGSNVAVRGVDFTIGDAEAFGLLGPNGAGKTTTLQMLVGALAPDAGSVRVEPGGSPTHVEARRHIGIAPQELAVYEELTAEENLAFCGRIQGLRGAKLRSRVGWGLELAGLQDRRRECVATYSGGMKRRLNLACAAIHQPKLLLLDEPTVGVDPQSRNHIFECIEVLKRQGCALVYTTHYMEEAERLCDRIAIMDHGEILAIDTLDALVAAHGGASLVEVELSRLPADPTTLPGEVDGEVLRIETTDPFEVIARLGRDDVAIRRLRVDRPDLERVFLHLTGRTLRD
jgi:ABC-2 type transport system ATP-binding protein